MIVDVIVALKDGEHLFGFLQNVSNRRSVLHRVGPLDIEALVPENNGSESGLLQVGSKPLEFMRRDARIRPFEIPISIMNTVLTVTGIENNEMEPAVVK